MIYDTAVFEDGMRAATARLGEFEAADLIRDGERAKITTERKAEMLEFLGAHMDGLRVRYWPVLGPVGLAGGQIDRRMIVRLSGMRDWTRGRHWDRRSRYGER